MDHFTDGYFSDECLQRPDRPCDELSESHFKQTMLANMKCVGEPVLDYAFPHGSDISDEIRKRTNSRSTNGNGVV